MPIRYRNHLAGLLDTVAATRDNYEPAMRVGILTTGQVVAVESEDVYELAGVDLADALSGQKRPGERIGAVADVRFAAPYVPGAKIVCHVVNYEAHATGVGPPSQP